VNAGIQETLGSERERKNFWAYNNGLTLICDDYDIAKNGKKVTLRNFSIVNGCQTTVSLANSPATALHDVRVLARFIRASERVIDAVITFNNSQNPIRMWDLNSQDKLQKKLKRELAKLPQPFFYALRKGELQHLSETERAKFRRDGKIQSIPHDLNAQYLAALRSLPAIGYKDKGKVFSIHRGDVFPPQTRPEEIVLAWQAGNVAKQLIKESLTEAIGQEEKERVAILKRGATFFVLAVVGLLLHQRNGQTFLNKLKPEVAASKNTIKRLTNYAKISLEWYVEVMQELIGAGHEVSSLVRSQEGWQKIKPKILSKWRVYSLSKDIMESALPKL
jgi:hypothetical protein